MERIATIHSRRRPLAVGAGVEFCCPSSDSFGALNEEATKDSTSSSHEALAVTEKPNVLLTTQISAQLTVMKDTGSLRRLRDFFSGSAHDSRCGQKHVIKAVESFLLQALRTLALTLDEAVRFDNKIHDVRSKCDHTKSWAQKFGIAGSSNGAKKA